MNTLSEYYGLLLGLDESRRVRVVGVDLQLDAQRVEIRLEAVAGRPVCCAQCGERRPLKDHAPERSWRHLDTMQFETVLTARVPRTECPACGVKTAEVPWAEPRGRFTSMFEAFALCVLQAAGSVKQASKLLGLTWESTQRIMDRAVARGLERRELDEVRHVGIDEKSFGQGHDYISVLTDIDGHRVLEVTEGRDTEAANALWNSGSPPSVLTGSGMPQDVVFRFACRPLLERVSESGIAETRMSSEKVWTTAFNLSGFEVVAATVEQAGQTIRLTVVPGHPVAVCPHCGGVCDEVRQTRDLAGVRDLPIADRAVELRVRVAQFWCSPCGRGFAPPVPGLAEGTHATVGF